MYNITFSPSDADIESLEKLYCKFDIGASGYPMPQWEGRNISEMVLERPLRWAFAPEVYLSRLKVNRRMAKPMRLVFGEMWEKWDPKTAEAEFLDNYVRCYAFGCDERPNPFWWGAGYRLSRRVSGVALEETIKIFTRHGFTWAGATDKKNPRDFYYL
jgi:hypothetical protein